MTKSDVKIPLSSINHFHVPVTGTAVLWLLLDRIRPAGWIVGAAWTLWAVYVLISIFGFALRARESSMMTAKEIDDRLKKLERGDELLAQAEGRARARSHGT